MRLGLKWPGQKVILMGYAERIVSALIAVACIVMLVRLAMGPARQQRVDRAVRDAWARTTKAFTRLYRRLISVNAFVA